MDPITAALLFLTGLVAGTLGGLLGIGGCVIMLPTLAFVFNYPLPLAIGTTITAVILTASSRAIGHKAEERGLLNCESRRFKRCSWGCSRECDLLLHRKPDLASEPHFRLRFPLRQHKDDLRGDREKKDARKVWKCSSGLKCGSIRESLISLQPWLWALAQS